MKQIYLALLLLLSACSTSQLVYECVDQRYGEARHALITGKSIDSAVDSYRDQTEMPFYCTRYEWRTKNEWVTGK